MKKIVLGFLLILHTIYGKDFIETAVSIRDWENSLKKKSGRTYHLFGQKQFGNHILNIRYMDILENTYQPPMPKDLEVQKLAFKYRYNISKQFQIALNYITIEDNLMPTDDGNMYGIGAQYNINRNIISSNYYKVIYDDFDVEQLDISIMRKFVFKNSKNSLKLIAKSTSIDGYKNKQFNPKAKLENADNHYFTVGLFLGTRYKTYFGKIGGFIGDRLFTVMNDGYMVQHHPMEIHNSFVLAVGKDFGKIRVSLRYNQHTTTSLPTNTQNIKVKVGTLGVRYSF